MFFDIAGTKLDNFIAHYEMGNLFLNVDAGWCRQDHARGFSVYKGYCDYWPMSQVVELVQQDQPPWLTGNFCVITYDSVTKNISIRSDLWRGFPIFIDDQSVNNLRSSDRVAWTDSIIDIDQDHKITETKFDAIGPISTDYISVEDAVNQIAEILDNKTQSWLSNNTLPIKAHLSGGVDSMLVFSFLRRHTNQYQLVRNRHIDYDKFWLLNHDVITDFWGYTQIHHWMEPCALISGAPGDEFMLRSPTTADLFVKYHAQNILPLLEEPKWQNCLHKSYFLRPKHKQIFEQQVLPDIHDRKQLFWYLCNIVINDWQHWHLGQTMTWTPLRDLDIFKIMLRLPYADSLGQILDSKISKDIIARNDPDLVPLISDQKNTGAIMKNLVTFLDQHAT